MHPVRCWIPVGNKLIHRTYTLSFIKDVSGKNTTGEKTVQTFASHQGNILPRTFFTRWPLALSANAALTLRCRLYSSSAIRLLRFSRQFWKWMTQDLITRTTDLASDPIQTPVPFSFSTRDCCHHNEILSMHIKIIISALQTLKPSE